MFCRSGNLGFLLVRLDTRYAGYEILLLRYFVMLFDVSN
jgi:hypothetical protein